MMGLAGDYTRNPTLETKHTRNPSRDSLQVRRQQPMKKMFAGFAANR